MRAYSTSLLWFYCILNTEPLDISNISAFAVQFGFIEFCAVLFSNYIYLTLYFSYCKVSLGELIIWSRLCAYAV